MRPACSNSVLADPFLQGLEPIFYVALARLDPGGYPTLPIHSVVESIVNFLTRLFHSTTLNPWFSQEFLLGKTGLMAQTISNLIFP